MLTRVLKLLYSCHPLPMFSTFSLSALTQGALLWVRLQVFKPRMLCLNAPNWVQGSERWWERWRNSWHFLQLCFTLCSEVPEATLLMPRVLQSLMKAATSSTLLTCKVRSSFLPPHLCPHNPLPWEQATVEAQCLLFIHSQEIFFSAPLSLICPFPPPKSRSLISTSLTSHAHYE